MMANDVTNKDLKKCKYCKNWNCTRGVWMNKNVNVYSFNEECYVYLGDYNKLKQENKQLKEDIKNIIRILDKNCDDLEATEEEFDSLYRYEKN